MSHSASELPSASGSKPAARNWAAVIWPGNLSSAANDELAHAIAATNSKAMGKWRCIISITVDFAMLSLRSVPADRNVYPTVLSSHDFRHAGDGDSVSAITVRFNGCRRIP